MGGGNFTRPFESLRDRNSMTVFFTGDEGRLHIEARQGLEGPAVGGLPQAMEAKAGTPESPSKMASLPFFSCREEAAFVSGPSTLRQAQGPQGPGAMCSEKKWQDVLL